MHNNQRYLQTLFSWTNPRLPFNYLPSYFLIKSGATVGSDNLLFAEIPILDDSKCSGYQNLYEEDKMICAGFYEVIKMFVILKTRQNIYPYNIKGRPDILHSVTHHNATE